MLIQLKDLLKALRDQNLHVTYEISASDTWWLLVTETEADAEPLMVGPSISDRLGKCLPPEEIMFDTDRMMLGVDGGVKVPLGPGTWDAQRIALRVWSQVVYGGDGEN